MRTRDSIAIGKLDARLLYILEAWRTSSLPREPVSVAVRFTGDLATLRAAGFEAPSMVHHPVSHVNLAAGSIAIERLLGLAALDEVLAVEGAYRLKPEIDESVPEIGAKALHEGTGFLPPLKGAKVVIGIIDQGFEVSHKTFRNPDGSTRILVLWDQTIGPPRVGPPTPQRQLEPGETSPAAPFNYGVEYSEAWINGALGVGPSLGPLRSKDRTNHGTSVAGIAAGNGLQPGNCHFAGHFVGVAPEAELILVRSFSTNNLQNSVEMQHAFQYIFTHPLILSRVEVPPVVVNFSQGDNLGPHDGSSVLETAIDALLLNRPGRVVVKSAGNEGDSKRHAEVPFPLGPPTDLQLVVGPDDSGFRTIEAWFPGTARLAVSVLALGLESAEVAPGGLLTPLFVVNPTLPEGEQTNVGIRSVLNNAANGRNSVTITIGTNSVIPAGPWIVRFRNVGPAATTVQAWLDNDGTKETHFASHVSRSRTITTPGTAQQVITVGAYDSKGRKGQLGSFSSQGPIDPSAGGTARTAPDLSAPGIGITSAKNGDHETSCCECCVTAYKGASYKDPKGKSDPENTGTSIAAPHVVGVVALMLERNPGMTAAQVRDILRQTAIRSSEFTGPRSDAELNTWGFGRVDAVAAVQQVPPFFGGGGGGGGPPPLALHHADAGPPRRELPPGLGGAGPHALLRSAAASDGGPGCQVLDGFIPFIPVFTAFRRHVLSSPEGQLCAALVSRHFSEVRGLIRSNRRVAVVWHRTGGPTFLRTLVGALIAREARGSTGATLPDLPARFAPFFAVLARYGSAELRADIDRHAIGFADLLRLALDRLQAFETAA